MPNEKRTHFAFRPILRDFKRALTNLAFWQLTLVMSLLFAGYIAFLSGTAVLFVVEFAMDKAVFPFVQASVLAGWVLGNIVLNTSLKKMGSVQVKRVGTILSVLGGTGFALTGWLAPVVKKI